MIPQSPVTPFPRGLGGSPPDTSPNQAFELELLKTEYFFLQGTIEDYNKQIWVIKALGITGTGAAMVEDRSIRTIALTIKQAQPLIALIGCAIPVFFWVLESQWKHYQRGFYPRVAESEQILTAHGLLNRSVFVSYGLEIGFLIALFLILKRIPITP